MKKKFAKIVSCLLCLAMLLSMAGPALAGAEDEIFEEIVFAPDLVVDDEQSIDAPDADGNAPYAVDSLPAVAEDVNPFAKTGKYEIYPTPQSVTYGTDTVTLPDIMQVVYGTGIDQYTKDRAAEAFDQVGVTLSESATTSVKLQVSISATVSVANKYDAYTLTIDQNGVTVVGQHTDAAFYGLTTVKRILQQVEGKQVKHLTMTDYADIPIRGFIEGYYGNPWTVEDRAKLMRFGGDNKMNIYFYAPKDDPKHSSKWREQYTEEELENKIRPLAEAGNASKCYYGFALHPFWTGDFDFSTEEGYAEDLGKLKAKFEQVMSVGVRQIAILGDDVGVPSVGVQNSYIRLMTDLSNWVKSDAMQAKYPGLKTTIPFCPNDYMGDASSAQMQALKALPESVPVIQTGGRIWGNVSHSYLNTYRTNMGTDAGVFMWVNWPCSDQSKGSLIMGNHDVVLYNDLTDADMATLQGVMINPMQQSEPSKAGIFQLADYVWNIWNGSDHQERKTNVWNDCFKYIDHDNAIETETSAALRELSKHMICNNGSGWRTDWHETLELKDTLTAFRTKMESGALTAEEVAAMRTEFQKLSVAADTYKKKTTGNTRILGKRTADGYVQNQEQMAPWLDYWVDFTQAALELLDALNHIVTVSDGSKDSEIVELYLSAQGNLSAAQDHRFHYVDHYEKAVAGGERLLPFVNALLTHVANTAKTLIDPTVLIESVITNRSDTPTNGLAAMRDGSESTAAVFKTPASLAVGDYVGVSYNRPITVNSIRFVLGDGGSDDNKNTFAGCKLEYTEDGITWKDVPGTPTFTHPTSGSWTARTKSVDISGLNLNAKAVRLTATEAVTDVWIGIKEIYINGKSGGETSDEPADGQLTGTIIKTSKWTVASGSSAGNLTDGNDSTYVWYDPDGSANDNDPADSSPAGDFIGLDLGSAQPVGQVRFVVGGDNGDKWTNFKLQYSTDNQQWTDAGEFTSTNNKDVITADLGGVSARYVRFVNTVAVNKWVKFTELTIYSPTRSAYDKIAYQSNVVKKIENPVGVLTDDHASLSSDMVMLRPGEFVGISLPRIRDVKEIVADYTPAPGLVLKAGMNEAALVVIDGDVDDLVQGAQLLANEDAVIPYDGYVRYVRLENIGEQTVSTRVNELSVTSEEVEPIHFQEDMTDMGFDANYGSQDNRETLNLFDGDMGTVTTLANAQTAEEYVTYDLGQLRPISKLTMAMAESNKNYLRHGVLEVSADGKAWTPILTVNNDGEYNSAVKDGAVDDPSFRLGVPAQNYAAFVGSVDDPVQARYLRIRVTQGGCSNFVAASEILINSESLNDIEYLPAVNDPTFEADPIESSAQYAPALTRDGDLTTGFRPNMTGRTEGSLIYRLSDETAIGQINVIQDTAHPSLATVAIRTTVGGPWQTLANVTLDKGLNQIVIPEKIGETPVNDVLEVKFSWGDVTPTFYEIITVPRAVVAEAGGQAPSEVETVPINSYSGDARLINFDENWKFNLGDASGAQAAVFNDSAWRTVDLPHDYSIEGEYTSSGEAESAYLIGGIGWYRKSFTVDPTWEGKVVTINFGGVYMDCEVYLNGTKLGEHHYGYSPFSFVLSNLNYSGENVIAVKTDDSFPSSRWYSGAGIYRSVNLTVTEPVHVAKYGTYVTTTNAGAVSVKTNVENNGASAANIAVKQEVFEQDPATFQKTGTAIASNTSAPTSVAAGATATVEQSGLNVPNPKLWNSWDKGDPNLYVLVTTVLVNGVETDAYETEFGFREIDWDVDKGFKLNGAYVKLKGVCQHHDQGGLGAEAWYRALERQVDILMDMGVNSIRVTHNPAADELVEICNRKGVLLIDEFFDGWHKAKNGNSKDFSRWFTQTIGSDNALVGKKASETWAQFVVETVVGRDKNAPSVIMYSLGNEIAEGTSGYDSGFDTHAQNIINWARAIDTTRLLTYGQNGNSVSQLKTAVADKLHAVGGVIGLNYYATFDPSTAHNSYGWRLVSSETVSHTNTRGVYDRKASNSDASKGDGLLTSYDKSAVGWGTVASDGWWRVIQYDYNAGEYIWTGFDYMGEPTPYNGTGSGKSPYWSGSFELAAKNSYFGAIDTNGLPKDNYWLYRSMWNDKSHTLHILPTWDREDLVISGGKVEVVVYTDAPMVKLYLNDTEVGSATATTNTTAAGHVYRTFNSGTGAFASKSGHETLYATFNVDYAEGTLRAVACDASGQPLNWVTEGRSQVRSTSGAAKLVATADRATIKNDGRDLSYITIDIVDSKGEIVNGAKNAITVSVTGDGEFMALDNGVQPDHTSFLSKTRKAGAGQLVAIVKSTKTADAGEFTLTATADGLSPAAVTVKTSGAASSTAGTAPVSYDISKTIYVQLNTEPTLPGTASVTLGNDTKAVGTIAWAEYDKSLLGQTGEFSVTGVITYNSYKIPVSIGVVVLDDVVALLNYSAATRVGQVPTLPTSRPAVMADGTVVNAQFGVTWTMPDAKEFQKEGTVVVEGTAADVFGETFPVTATIRVSAGEFIEGSSVSSAAKRPKVNDVENNDLLKAFDGNTSTSWTGSGKTQIAFDTAQNLYRIVLRYATTVPTGVNAPTIKLDGGNVTVKPKVSGTTATYELGAINSSVDVIINFPGEVTLASVDLVVATPVFAIGSTAELDGINLNGKAATAAQLAARLVKTSAATAVVSPVSNDNVAVTVIPENSDSTIILVTESEDHTVRDKYVIHLDSMDDIDATDSTNDYPYAKTTATAGSDQGSTVGSAVDGSESTIWHSAYSGSSSEGAASDHLVGFPEKRWFQLTLEEATELVALRYKPRSSQTNGTVKDYRIEVSTNGSTWTTVAEGQWDSSADWKIAMFDKAVTAKYVKLWGVNTYGDGSQANYFMSAAEVRAVKKSATKTDLSAATITVTPGEFQWKNVEIRPGSGSEADVDATVVVSLFGEVLTRGTDYVLSYENNVEPGTAYIYATAPASSTKYQGAAAGTFKIVKTEAKITSFEPFTVRVYPSVAPTLPTTTWANTQVAGSSVQNRVELPVTWDEVPEEWYNFPKVKTRTLDGAIEDPDMLSAPGLKPTLTLNFAYSQSVDDISGVTPVGVMPVLPSQVTVQFDDGTSAPRTVSKWYIKGDANKDPLTAANFTTAGLVELEGEIVGIDRVKASASIRVAQSTSSDVNKALNNSERTYTGTGDSLKLTAVADTFPMALAYWSSGNNNPYQAIQGTTTGSTEVNKRWSDWESGTVHNPTWFGVAFETSTQGVTAQESQVLTLVPHTVNRAKIMFVDESGTGGAVTFPDSYQVQYYTGPIENLTFDTRTTNGDTTPGNGRVREWSNSPLNDDANWANVTLTGTQPAVPSSNGQMLTVVFEPVSTAILRVLCVPKQNSGNKWVGVQALEAYGLNPPAANADFAITSLTLGDQDVNGAFTTGSDGVHVLERLLAENAAIPQLAITADSNAAISIIQASRVPGVPEAGAAWAKATVTSEDGSKTETYIVKFLREGAPAGYFIDFDSNIASSDRVTISPNGGPAGQEITVAVAKGYQLTDLWVKIMDGPRAGELITVKDGKFFMPPGNVSFSANVSAIPYKITYLLNEGTVERHNTTSYTVETPTFTLYNPTRGGYTFQGWVGTGLSVPTQTVTVSRGSIGDRTYIAVWSANSSIGGGGGNNGGGGGGGGISAPVGDVTSTTTNPVTGAVTVTTATSAGLVTAVTTNTDGTQSAVVQIPQLSSSIVNATMPTLNAEVTPEVKIQNNTGRPVSLTVPVTGSATVVAVRQEADGTETVIPFSIMDENGLRLQTQPGDQTIRIVDNKKTFTDVPETHWAAESVAFASSRELFNGMGSTDTFAPTGSMTRAMMTTVLWRLAEKPEVSMNTLFDDVLKGSYYEDAVSWGVATGVVKGTDNGFEPDTPITRETLAVMLYRAAGSPVVVDEMPRRFTDGAQVADWAQEAMIWCIQNDILTGYPDNTLGSKREASRAEVATMLQRFVDHQV